MASAERSIHRDPSRVYLNKRHPQRVTVVLFSLAHRLGRWPAVIPARLPVAPSLRQTYFNVPYFAAIHWGDGSPRDQPFSLLGERAMLHRRHHSLQRFHRLRGHPS